jgi:PST family polysaccharide transporter
MDGSKTSDDGSGFARKAAANAASLGASQLGRILLTFASAVVIARLLSPDEYGVVAMAAPVIGFIGMFQELGLGAAAIQSKTLTTQESSSLFWINIVASAVVAAALLALAPLAALFYHDVRAGYVTAAGAVGAIISAFAIQHATLLNRDMRFAMISIIEFANALASFVVAALLAVWLRSYWSLILGSITGTFLQTVLTWRSTKWRPNLRPSFSEGRRFLRFGGNVTGYNVVNFALRNADNIMIGKVAGSVQLGLYDRSYKLMMMPLQSLSGPMYRLLMPMLSHMQDDPERYRRTFVFTVRALGLVAIPGIAIAAALSDRLMPFVLGDRWASAGPIFFWLGLAGLFNPIANLTGVLFVTTSRSAAYFRWGLFSAVVTLVGFVVGIFWGAEGVAASFFVTTVIRTPLLFAYSVGNTGVTSVDLYRAQFEPMIASAFGVAVTLALAPYFSIGPLFVLGLVIVYLVSGIAALATPAGRETVLKLAQLSRGFAGDAVARVQASR